LLSSSSLLCLKHTIFNVLSQELEAVGEQRVELLAGLYLITKILGLYPLWLKLANKKISVGSVVYERERGVDWREICGRMGRRGGSKPKYGRGGIGRIGEFTYPLDCWFCCDDLWGVSLSIPIFIPIGGYRCWIGLWCGGEWLYLPPSFYAP